MLARLADLWSNLSLARRFALAAAPVLLAAMAVLGLWVTSRIAEGVVRNTGSATALWLDGVIAPLNDELASGQPPSPIALRALAEVFARPDIALHIAEFRIWGPDATLLFSTNPELTGGSSSANPDLQAALAGQVTTEFGLGGAEDGGPPSPAAPDLIEIYAPIREAWSGRIIAAAEVYQTSADLAADLRKARNRTWAVVAATTLAMGAALFGIVRTGSETIKQQQEVLQRRLAAMQVMAEQNRDLRLRVQAASGRATALNERYLRKISADLHDGPAQNLAAAALRLHRIAGLDKSARTTEAGEILAMLDAAMQEIRGISRDLILPELEGLPLADLLARAASQHESRSGTAVALETTGIDSLTLTHAQNICAFRFVQEGLTNAFKHGGGQGQTVSTKATPQALTLTVTDHGGGRPAEGAGLGLAGLRERIESIGGSFTLASTATGAILTMTLPTEPA